MNAETMLKLLETHKLSDFENKIKGQTIELSEFQRFLMLCPSTYYSLHLEQRIKSLMIIRICV